MLRTKRPTHRAEGKAITDYSALLKPVSKGAISLTAATATAGTMLAANATVANPPANLSATASLATKPTHFNQIRLNNLGSQILKTGSSGSHVANLQTLLNQRGANLVVDGHFGPATRNAVINFQSNNSLVVDGIVGPATKSALQQTATSTSSPAAVVQTTNPARGRLSIGSRGQSVKDLQTLLNNHGANLVPDAIFGNATDSAVKSFQRQKGLEVDGIVGPQTWAALANNQAGVEAVASVRNEVTAATYQTPKPANGFNSDSMVQMAHEQVGKPYAFGASGPHSFDCSGLVSLIYQQHGIKLPRTAKAQSFGGKIISRSEAVPGDIVSFPGLGYNHVGIYLGDNMMIDAGTPRTGVVKRKIWTENVIFVSYR